MPRHWSLCFLVSPCYSQSAMPCQWSLGIYHECYGFVRAFFTLWIHTIQSHIFLFFTYILQIFFHFFVLSLSFKIVTNSSWLISMSIDACDTKVSMLLSLLLANVRILSYFFFSFLVMLSKFLIIPVVKEKIKVKLAVAIPTGAPTMLVKEIIDFPPVVALKIIKNLVYVIKGCNIFA